MIAPPLAGKILGSAKDSFAVAEWRDGGGPPGPPRLIAPVHVHHLDDEAWYVLEGKLCVQAGGDTVDVPAGSGIMVPRGTKHTYWNPGTEPVRYLIFMTPTILKLIQAMHELQDRSPAALAVLFEQYDSSLIGSV
jgi:mannose-6-phosphate isomerase-like protein (cupin superfamily)